MKRSDQCEATDLKFSPKSTFTAADTVHDPGDVFKMEAELLLKEKREETATFRVSVCH